jgi:hypothetical protein
MKNALFIWFLIILLPFSFNAQRGTERFDETGVFVGYGTTNLLSIVNIPSSTLPYVPGFYIEGGKQLNNLSFLKGGLYLNLSGTRNNVNLRTLIFYH